MGSRASLIICLIIFSCLCSSPLIQSMGNIYDPQALDDFIQDFAQSSIPKRHSTGILYNVTLPSNFTSMEVSIVRLRSGSFHARGANFSFFDMPPRIILDPFVERLDIVYSNLANWSSYYYNVPDYSFVAPVVGFNTYSSRNTSGQIRNLTDPSTKVNISVAGDPIVVRFPHVSLTQGRNGKCVVFRANGTIEMTNMTLENTCIVRDQGHFSVVVSNQPLPPPPSPPPPPRPQVRRNLWRWWVIGFAVGIFGLLLLGLVMFTVIGCVRKRKIGKMEKQSERNEALDTTYVGHSRMPSASGMRTQPVLEDDYFP